MKKFLSLNAGLFSTLTSAALVFLMFSSISHAAGVRQLWQSREQFVALEGQDYARDSKTIANNHPSEFSEARLTAILASLEVRTSDSSGVEPLFTRDSLDALVPQLQLGLRQALPGEDVTFAVIGLHKAMFGFAKTAKVTTGRLFVQSGQLNIIFGLVRQDVNERDDRRLVPFTPGKRTSVAVGDWKILPKSTQDVALIRKDWVAFAEGWNPPLEQPAVPAVKTEPVASVPAQAVKRVEDTRSPSERLNTLIDLKNKGLISEDEYRSKRMEILNGL
jgi:hypothetical protein